MKYKNFILLSLAIFLSCLTGCEVMQDEPQMTSLQIQSIQSREFETNKRTAFDSTVTVFQDLGYIINSAEYNTGFITAESPTARGAFFGPASTKIRATAFVQETKPNNTKIRLNFVAKDEYINENGISRFIDKAITNPKMYQDAFTKIQEQIFIVTPFPSNNK